MFEKLCSNEGFRTMAWTTVSQYVVVRELHLLQDHYFLSQAREKPFRIGKGALSWEHKLP